LIDDRYETKRGMWWLGSATAVARAIDVASSLVLLALLTREEMGTAALVVSTGAIIEAASGMGIGHALIQSQTLTKPEEHSLFWLTSAIGLGLGLVLVAISPLVAREYGLPLLLPMIALTGLKHFFVGVAVVPQQLLNKQLKFRELGAIQALSTFFEALAKIALAALGFGAWAVVLSNVLRGVVLVGLVLGFSGFRPQLHFSWAESRGYLRFGTRIAGSSLLYHAYKNADYFLVGRLLGVEVLGVYRVAFDLAMQPLEVIILLVNRVTYPIYVKLAHDAAALRNALLRSTRSLILLGAPAVAFLFLAAEDVLAMINEGRWGGAAPALRVLVWGGLLRGGAHLFPQVYIASGRPHYALVDSVSALVVLVSGFTIGLSLFPELGMMSVCWTWLAAYPLLLCVALTLTRRIMPITTLEYLRAFLPGVAGALVMIAAMKAALSAGLGQYGLVLAIAGLATVGLAAYASYLRVALKIGLRELVPKKQLAPASTS
jgi:O-antigen/teichoic acid export membrane protein